MTIKECCRQPGHTENCHKDRVSQKSPLYGSTVGLGQPLETLELQDNQCAPIAQDNYVLKTPAVRAITGLSTEKS